MDLQAHTFLFLLVYALILILPYTKWRDRLPAKPSFYRYIVVLVGVNLLAALGARATLPEARGLARCPALLNLRPHENCS